jgi:hypothetical protein
MKEHIMNDTKHHVDKNPHNLRMNVAPESGNFLFLTILAPVHPKVQSDHNSVGSNEHSDSGSGGEKGIDKCKNRRS